MARRGGRQLAVAGEDAAPAQAASGTAAGRRRDRTGGVRYRGRGGQDQITTRSSIPDYQFILVPKLREISAQYSVSKLANASAACILVLLHVFHVFGMPCMCIRMSCVCSSACPACARQHALHVWICLSVFVYPLTGGRRGGGGARGPWPPFGSERWGHTIFWPPLWAS